jgi:hypothetical protein
MTMLMRTTFSGMRQWQRMCIFVVVVVVVESLLLILFGVAFLEPRKIKGRGIQSQKERSWTAAEGVSMFFGLMIKEHSLLIYFN